MDSDLEKLVHKYLSQNHIIILDSVSRARVSLAAQLVKLGAIRNRMSLVSSVEEAEHESKKHAAKVIFSDYFIGNRSGLDLIMQQKQRSNEEKVKDGLFVLVTANPSQSAVARAVEEDVDTFLIKPYSFDNFKKALSRTIFTKLRPSLYIQLIDRGKEEMVQGKLDDAILTFGEAMLEHETPTLACFYYGQVEFMKEAIQKATEKYEEGLNYNQIHYKCLLGLYDIFIREGKHHEA